MTLQLSLSVRIAESFTSKHETTMSFDEILAVATSLGYPAICMRASQAGIESSPDGIREMRAKIDEAGLRVSMVTGDFAVPRNDEHGPEIRREISEN